MHVYSNTNVLGFNKIKDQTYRVRKKTNKILVLEY